MASRILNSIPSQTIKDRFQVIERFIHQGSVLDLGVVDSRPQAEATAQRINRLPNMLFRRINELTQQLIGVDIDAEGVAALNEQGYKVVCADVQKMDLAQTFDTIIAGELIEHLENPGMFLRNMVQHLKPRGTLIISTPNPFYAKQGWKIWRYNRPSVHEDHTCWFDPLTLAQLMQRVGLKPVESYWIQPKSHIFKAWRRYFRGYFSHSFLIVARRLTEDRSSSEGKPD